MGKCMFRWLASVWNLCLGCLRFQGSKAILQAAFTSLETIRTDKTTNFLILFLLSKGAMMCNCWKKQRMHLYYLHCPHSFKQHLPMPGKIFLPWIYRMRNINYICNRRFVRFSLWNNIVGVSIHISCLKRANNIIQIKQTFTECCLKHTRGRIVWRPFVKMTQQAL